MAVVEGERQEIERKLESAVRTRVQHFKDQADSLTLESVRRLLEKDLGLEEFSLDVHKRFIRDYLEKAMESADSCNSEASTESVEKNIRSSKEAKMLPKKHNTKKDPKKTSTGDEEIMEDSPIMGVLTSKSDVANQEPSISESSIEKAIWERADHFHANSTNITLAGVRRLLEEDLGLEKNSLDPFKKFISQQIDQVFASPKEDKHVKDVKKKAPVNLKAKKSKKVSSEERSNSSHDESDEMEVEVNPRKVAASKRNIKNMEQPKKRKISEVKQNRPAKRQKEEENDNDEDRSSSEEKSQPPVKKTAQKKEMVASGHGKRVENLKSVIKACGMSVAPSIYKKAKQVPEEKREAFIVKELEEILSREGLSRNPTEKEIKDCKKRKDTSRELEGIDMINIISSSRRRSTFSFVSPVTSGVRAKKDKVDAKDSKSKDKDKNRKVVDVDDDNDNDNDDDDDDDDDECKKENDDKEEDKNEDDEEEKEKDGEEEEVEEEDEEEDEEEEDDDDESEDFDEDDNDESD